jgi:hypothetical protein
LGAGILIGAAVGGGMAAYNGADSKEIAQAAMFGGLTGAIGGGVGNVVGRGLMAGLSRAASSNFVRTRFPALASGMSAGGSESLADDFLHGRKLNWKNAGIAALTAGGMLVGGSLGIQLMNATTPTGPIAGIKAANQTTQKASIVYQGLKNSKTYTPVQFKGTVKVDKQTRDISWKVYQRNDIDWYATDGDGLSNLQRMKEGRPPIGSDGKQIELHHVIQKESGPMVEIMVINIISSYMD